MDGHLPLHLWQNTESRGGQNRLHTAVHHLRHFRLQIHHQEHNKGDGTGRQKVQGGSHTEPHKYSQEQPDNRRGIRQRPSIRAGRLSAPDAETQRDIP